MRDRHAPVRAFVDGCFFRRAAGSLLLARWHSLVGFVGVVRDNSHMATSCTIDDCEAPHFGRGYCNLHYYRLVRKPKRDVRMATCAWCGERKRISEMRHPDSSRGPTPSTCHACRTAHPSLGWCDFHQEPHPRDRFTPVPSRPIGYNFRCVAAESELASNKRELPPIRCAACAEERSSWQFRGGRAKSVTCRACEDEHPEDRWCLDCAAWLPRGRFTPTGKGGRNLSSRCVPCRTANTHGVTVAQVLAAQGSERPECAACGSVDFLKIDHDHSHCPTASGCAECVRGYLCHSCNTAEGLLRTPERARLLLAYMERVTPSLRRSTP